MAGSRLFTVAVCASLLASVASAAAESSPEALGQIIDRAVARAPQCVGLAIGATQGSVRGQRFYGESGNHRRPGPDTIFAIGSITKTFVASIVLQLVSPWEPAPTPAAKRMRLRYA